MKFTKIMTYGPDSYTYQVCGIYKITTYRGNEHYAYFIPNHYDNWGEHVSPPPDKSIHGGGCWKTLRAAKAACKNHAKTHQPSDSTIKKAAKIKAKLIQQERDFHCAKCCAWFDQYGKCSSCEVAA